MDVVLEKLIIPLMDHVPRNAEKEDIVAVNRMTNITCVQKCLNRLIHFLRLADTTASVKVINRFMRLPRYYSSVDSVKYVVILPLFYRAICIL